MKKFLAVLFAVIFAVSCMSVMAFADDDAAASSIVIPSDITLHHETKTICPYCYKVCGNDTAYAAHLEECEAYQSFIVNSKENTCYYCGKVIKSEAALNEHYAIYVNATDHIATCPYSGDDYIDGGCNCQFTTKEELAKHIAQCPYEGQYSLEGWKNVFLGYLKDFFLGIFKNADWSGVLDGLKSLVAGFDLDLLKDTFNAGMNALDVDFNI